MNKELKDKWVRALRSGDYKQGFGTLRNDVNQYCCLGVLCAVNHQEIVGDHEDNYRWFRKESVEATTFWQMNDVERKSFNEIADYIEANIPGDE